MSSSKRNRHSNASSDFPIQLIYAGGTFGSYGKPLSTLPADTLLPVILEKVYQKVTDNIQVLPNRCVKDSSQLTPSDFVHFYQLILKQYQAGSRHYVLITGTDTLSYLGSFLAEAFAGSDVCILLTASMRPLFDTDNIHSYEIDNSSDAWDNLTNAIGLAQRGTSGVYVAFAGESWPAQTVQKIHSHDLMAFTGHSRAGYPANSYVQALPSARRQHWIDDSLAKLEPIVNTAPQTNIATLYCVPNNSEWFDNQFASLDGARPTGMILIGFGAGNLPRSTALAKRLDALHAQGHMLVCTTQCAFGGVSAAYAAGSWQYEHHVTSGGRLTIAAIYARLLWLHLAYDSAPRRRQRWTYSVGKTQMGIQK